MTGNWEICEGCGAEVLSDDILYCGECGDKCCIECAEYDEEKEEEICDKCR